MRDHVDEIESWGGQVAVVSFARPAHVGRFARHLNHPYLWLADPDRLSYHALGADRRGLGSIAPPHVLWEHVKFALRGRIWHPEQLDLAQMAGDFVFDRAGNLTLRHVSTASDDRPPVTELMEAFRRAAAASAAD